MKSIHKILCTLLVSFFVASSLVLPSKAAPLTEEATFPNRLGVVFIGDSIGVGLAPYLAHYFPNMYADAKPCRQFYQAKDIIKELLDAKKLPSTVVIELGTNGRVEEEDVRALIDMVGSNRKVIFVNCQVPRSWCEGDNKTFAKVVPEYANTIIADWYSASIDNSAYFYNDGVHPNKTGLKIMARTVADAISKILPHKPYTPVPVSAAADSTCPIRRLQ